MEIGFLLIFLLILGFFGGITGAIANSMGHKFWPFFFLGALISPVLGIILCFIIKPAKKSRSVSRFAKRRPSRGTARMASTNRIDPGNPYSPPRRNYR